MGSPYGSALVLAALLVVARPLDERCATDNPLTAELRDFIAAPADVNGKTFSRVFEQEQVLVTRGACVARDGVGRDAWFALGDDAGATALRARYCGAEGRVAMYHNGTRGRVVGGGVRDLVPKAVIPWAGGRADGLRTRWRLYKRCGPPLRNGRPAAAEHLEIARGTDEQLAAARGATWVNGPVVLASDMLQNVGHAVRDVLLLNAFAREWSCATGGRRPRYALLRARRNPEPPLPWVSGFFAAVAETRALELFDPAPNTVTCARALVQKASQHVGDARDARDARDSALAACGVDGAAPPTELLYVRHGPSREGARTLANEAAALAALRKVAADRGLSFGVVELGGMPFCDQVRRFYGAAVVVGVFGAAIGGNLVFGHDATTTLELTACGHSKRDGPRRGNLGASFQPLAAAIARGHVVFCLCVDDTEVDLGAKRSVKKGGWFRSARLFARAAALGDAAAYALAGDHASASSVGAASPCGGIQAQGGGLD